MTSFISSHRTARESPSKCNKNGARMKWDELQGQDRGPSTAHTKEKETELGT